METQNTKIPRKILGYFMAFAMVFLTSANTFAQDLYITTEVCGAQSSSLVSDCSDFVSGPAAFPYVLVATTVADGAASQGAQTFTMNVTSLPAGGADFRVAKTVANGNWFNGNAQALTLGSNTFTVAAVTFDRAVKFQFSSGDVEFDALSLNGSPSLCNPPEVRMTGPWWNWDPLGGPVAVNNGNGTWTFTLPLPGADMEYLLVVDGVQENLVNAPHPDIDGDGYGDLWGCAPVTDYWSYANRQWTYSTTDTLVSNTYATCGTCSDVYGCMDATATNYDAAANVNDQSVCTFAPPPAPMENLFFSEYAEGSSNNKYLEIYNPSANTVDLADYAYPSVSNAVTTPGAYEYWNDFDPGATIAPGGIYVIAHGSADPAILAFADETHTYLSNGDDGYALVYGDNTNAVDSTPTGGGYVILDMIGDWQVDPGSGWDVAGVSNGTKEHTLVRKCDVTAGNMGDWTTSAGTDSLSSEWIVYDQDEWSYLGSHTTPCAVPVLGCTDATACNYDAAADTDDGSCTYAAAGFDCAGNCLVGDLVTVTLYDTFGDGGGQLTVDGNVLTNSGASNSMTICLDLLACTDVTYASTDIWSYENSWDITDASGAVIASGNDASGLIGNTPGFDCAGNCLVGDLVTVTLYDSFGDGGGQLTVDGNVLTNSGASNSMTICLDLLACTDVTYASTDSWSYENSWIITDASGAVIASGNDASGDVGACAVLGCTDATADNYDPLANTDDGSCTYCTDNYVTISCDGGLWQSEVSWTLTNSSGTVVASGGAPYSADICLPSDCYTVDMVDSFGDGWNGNIFDISLGTLSLGTATINNGSSASAEFSIGAVCLVYGCIDPTAVNYDPAADTDDGSCYYACTAAPVCESFEGGAGTWINNGWSNNTAGTVSGGTGPNGAQDGSFYMYFETSGTPAASIDMTSECFDISSLVDPTLSFYTHMLGATIGTLSAVVNGDTLWTMSGDQGAQWNFVQVDLSAYVGQNITINLSATYGGGFTGDIAIDNVCVDELLVIDGCTDPTALNYDPSANNDDGSCAYCSGTFVNLNMGDSFGDGSNGGTWTFTGTNTGNVYGPYTIGSGAALTEAICMDDDCYDIVVGGGTWDSEMFWTVTATNGDTLASAGTSVGGGAGTFLGALGVNVTCPIYGCIDPTALNFDSIADTDDGSCAYLCDPYIASSVLDAAPSCNGAFDASATATIIGSFGNDFWLWDNGTTSSTATGLAAGTYSCTITDSVNGCTSVTTITIDPTPVISINGTSFDATPGNLDGGVTTSSFGGTPCYNGASANLQGVTNTTTQWASNAFDVVASSDLQITSVEQPTMSGVGTADVYYRLGSGQGYEMDPNGWILAGSNQVLSNFVGDITSIPVSINMLAGQTICIYVVGVGVNTNFGAGPDSTYNSVVSTDGNLSIISGFASGGAPGAGTTLPSATSYDFGGSINYSLSSYTYEWSDQNGLIAGATSSDLTGVGIGPISVVVTDCNGCTATETFFVLENFIYGCIDTLASNFDAAANTSWEFDTTGTTPACLFDGCTDSLANNYDVIANNDDGSCTYSCAYYGFDNELTVTFTPDWFTSENTWYILDAFTGDTAMSSGAYGNGGAVDIQTLCANNGCYYLHGYDTFGDGWGNGSGSLDITDASGNSVGSLTLGASTTFNSELVSFGGANCSLGCTDTAYANFDVNAVIDDGSCSDTIVGCTDPTASNYTPFSNVDDGSCCYDNIVSIIVDGGSWQSEVSWNLTNDNGTYSSTGGAPYNADLCLPDGCYTVDMFDSFGDGWNGNLFTALSNGNIIGQDGLLAGDTGMFTFSVGAGICPAFGCMDALASNYDANANIDDGSCCFDNVLVIETGLEVTPGDLNFGLWSNWVGGWNVTLDGDTNIVLEGQDLSGFGFFGDDNSGCLPDGCYEFNATGTANGGWAWFNINGTQYDGPTNGGAYGSPSSVLFTLGNAICPVYGCMDTLALNYDPVADTDDGSCAYPCTENEIAFNMYDSWGDGWNGATYTVTDAFTGTQVATGGLVTGAFEIGTLCLPDGCYDVVVGGGTFDSEITFDFDTTLVTASAGSYTVSVGNSSCPVFGCTDPTALNYDSTATYDDGTCVLSCTVAPYCENFDAGIPADWNNSGWTLNSGTTGSLGTGPFTDVSGVGNYMYYETSGSPDTMITLTSLCLDISALASPTLEFYNHMLGATMGTLDVLVNGTNVWSQSGDQGGQWNWAQVDLSAYAGSVNLTIEFVGNYGTGFTGDMAIDEVCVQEFTTVLGCTDPLALNYNATANTDDGSCNYCTDNQVGVTFYDSFGDGWNGAWMYVYDSLGDSVTSGTLGGGAFYTDTLCLVDGCYEVVVGGGSWDGEITFNFGTLLNSPAGTYYVPVGNGVCPTYGCTDSNAVNYDPIATADDGSCDYLGCTNPTAANYDPMATIDDGSCTFGCTDNTVVVDVGGGTWDSEISWTILDGAGNVVLSGGAPYSSTECLPDDCYTVDMVDSFGDGWNGGTFDMFDGSGMLIVTDGLTSGAAGSFTVQIGTSVSCAVLGCTDPNASNYDATATQDDGSCTYPCLLDEVTLTLSDSFGDGWNGNTLTVDGVDYTQSYTSSGSPNDEMFMICIDLSTCIDVVYNALGSWGYENSWTITDASGTVLASGDNLSGTVTVGTCAVTGCTDSTAINYDAAATVDDGSCIATVYGCTDATQSNYDPLANVDDGSCIPVVFGCTDPLATNYNATVNTDDGSCLYAGCTDPAASNYDANATIDDGSCIVGPSLCAGSAITGLSVSDIIHDRVTFNFDNMNTYDGTGAQVCRVDQIRIKYRPVGTSSWSQKNMAQPTGYDVVTGVCNSTQNTAKITRQLLSSTTYEWEVKVWYCDGQNTGFVAGPNFTTLDDCPNVGNLTAVGANPTMATFTWDDSNGAYSFVRLKARVDSISNPSGSDFFQIGGAGVSYGTYTKNKQNMVPGETYRGQARTYCDPNGGPYRAPNWTPLVFWTQPTVRIEGGVSIANLDVYPNPSRDVFNVAFTSEDVQDLEVRVINVVGEVVYTENLQQFVGEYTKLIDLAENTKGVYFLEITTNTGVVNKKLMLQ